MSPLVVLIILAALWGDLFMDFFWTDAHWSQVLGEVL